MFFSSSFSSSTTDIRSGAYTLSDEFSRVSSEERISTRLHHTRLHHTRLHSHQIAFALDCTTPDCIRTRLHHTRLHDARFFSRFQNMGPGCLVELPQVSFGVVVGVGVSVGVGVGVGQYGQCLAAAARHVAHGLQCLPSRRLVPEPARGVGRTWEIGRPRGTGNPLVVVWGSGGRWVAVRWSLGLKLYLARRRVRLVCRRSGQGGLACVLCGWWACSVVRVRALWLRCVLCG